jgi:hypothetical protein
MSQGFWNRNNNQADELASNKHSGLDKTYEDPEGLDWMVENMTWDD